MSPEIRWFDALREHEHLQVIEQLGDFHRRVVLRLVLGRHPHLGGLLDDLFPDRVHAIVKKIVEEAAEVWMAAEYESDEATAEEISQLLYHLQVLMVAKGLTPADVWRHL